LTNLKYGFGERVLKSNAITKPTFGAVKNMREAYIWITVAFLTGILVGTFATAYMTAPLTNPDVMQVNNITKNYTMQWNAQNTTLTLVFRDGNSTDFDVVTGQTFVCNASSKLFLGDRLLYQFP